MAILVSDSFDRANNPTTLGTADTGQVWSQVSGTWGIFANAAQYSFIIGVSEATGVAVIESGLDSGITKGTLVEADPPNFACGVGVICRYVDINNYWRLFYMDAPGTHLFRLQRTYLGSTSTVLDPAVGAFSPGDTIAVAYCGRIFEIYHNDVLLDTYDDTGNPFNYGTQCGMFNTPGTFFADYTQSIDDFLVTTNGTCAPTYNCIEISPTEHQCIDPGDGSGVFGTLEACHTACDIPVTYNCIGGTCVDPGDGSGEFDTLLECQLSGCETSTHTAATEIFDAGEGGTWYMAAHLSDSGEELRAKNIKTVRVTGKLTDASAMIYGYNIGQPVNVPDLEDGVRTNVTNITRPQTLPDSTEVTQTARKPVNVIGAMHTVRVQGDDTGEAERDRVDEIVYEQSVQDARR